MKRFFNYSFSIFLVQFILFAQNKSVVAVLDFNNDDPGLQQHLEDHLKKAQYIELMPRNVWFNLLSQKVNRSRFRPTNTSAAAKMGKMIKADYIVYGTSKYGFILVNLIDVANRSKATAIRRNFNTNQLAYYDMVPEIIKSLDQKLSNLTGYKQPKKIFAPPALAATLKFDEPSGNQYLDALETGKITLEIINTGSGLGTGIVTTVNPKSTAYLNYKVPEKIPVIKSGDSYNIDILLDARIGIDDAVHTLQFEFKEDNGFPPDPVEIQFSTKAYLKPEIYIVDVGIDDQNVNGMIEPGEIIKLTVRVGNRGKGTAKNTIARFYEGSDNVYLNDNPPNTVSIGDLFYNEYIDIPLEFFINMNAKEEIPLFVDLLEKSNKDVVREIADELEDKAYRLTVEAEEAARNATTPEEKAEAKRLEEEARKAREEAAAANVAARKAREEAEKKEKAAGTSKNQVDPPDPFDGTVIETPEHRIDLDRIFLVREKSGFLRAANSEIGQRVNEANSRPGAGDEGRHGPYPGTQRPNPGSGLKMPAPESGGAAGEDALPAGRW